MRSLFITSASFRLRPQRPRSAGAGNGLTRNDVNYAARAPMQHLVMWPPAASSFIAHLLNILSNMPKYCGANSANIPMKKLGTITSAANHRRISLPDFLACRM